MTAQHLNHCEAVHGYISRICFKNGPPRRVGAELEWFVRDRDGGFANLPHLRAAAERWPGRSRLTFEPGGQVELSSPVAQDLNSCWRTLSSDVGQLERQLSQAGLRIDESAGSSGPAPRRQLSSPRYDSMEEYFVATGQAGAGRQMMTGSAALQLNLDMGHGHREAARRWHLLHCLGPTLVAVFANSPSQDGRWRSDRQRMWQHLDPSRTSIPAGADHTRAWSDYALDAPVMMVRRPPGQEWEAHPGFTFRDWVEGRAGAPPTTEDLDYHLTTLFPPVRPRGWFEVRYLDAQSPTWWPVAVAVLWSLTQDSVTMALAAEITATTDSSTYWLTAAREALGDPALHTAALGLFEVAQASLHRAGTDVVLLDLVEEFRTRFVSRGRSPADEALPSEAAV